MAQRQVPFRSGNPALNRDVFDAPSLAYGAPAAERMTVQGTVNKTAILLALALASAVWAWTGIAPDARGPAALGGALVGLALAIAIIVRKRWAPALAPVYALAEGVVLGAVSSLYEELYAGITLLAVGLTFGTLATLLAAYTSRLIRVTHRLRAGIVAATGGILLVYLVSLVLGLFGVAVPFINDASPVGILISLVIVIVAALNLVLDFDFIERGAASGAPKYLEWYGAFGLLVTLVWLYLEILRLLSKLRR